MDTALMEYLFPFPLIRHQEEGTREYPGVPLSESAPPLPLLVVTTPLAPEHRPVLGKMMQACRLTEDQYQVMEMEPDQRFHWPRIKERFRPQRVLLLGIPPAQLGVQARFPWHYPSNFDQRRWIAAWSLPEMEARPEHKKALWTRALKPEFLSQGEKEE